MTPSEEAFRQDLGYFVLIALRFPRPMSWCLLRRQRVFSKPTKKNWRFKPKIPKAIAMGNAMDPRNLFCFGTSIFE